MKNNLTTILFLVSMTFLFSCKKEYSDPENNNSCNISSMNHPKNNQYQSMIDRYTKDGFVGLTVLVDDSASGLWIGSSGYADIEHNVKMTPCHCHHTASIYKTYIAVIIMQLVGEGKIKLEDHLTSYIPGDILDKIPNGNAVTVENLLQHRTGIPDIFETDFLLDFFNKSSESYSIETLLGYVYNKKALSNPGTEFFYSDANYALLSMIINKFDGDYGNSIKTRIFQQLNLTESFFLNTSADAPEGLADSYWDRFGNGKIENVSDWQIDFTSGLKGTDGIVATANDMKIFLQALANGKLVPDSLLSGMTAFLDVPESERQKHGITGYGYGLMRVNVGGDTWYGHFGNHIGSGAIALYNPNRKITIVAFENTGTFFSDKIKPKFYNQLIRDIEAVAY
ncbi:MAG: serine hydrolase [Bacteroidetes bacterium]|nr:serine hydrolase [Bacteroidota bacterium]